MTTKRLKKHGGTEGNREPESISEDRVSELPDAVILHILSFLPTIVAVRMSILSKRWRYMWTLIPILDFKDSRDVEYFRRPNYEKNNERKRFFSFVDRCLNHPYADTTITGFKLEMEFYGAGNRIDDWLRFPVKRNVKELDLHVRPARAIYCLPSDLLLMKKLTLLKLDGLRLEVPIVCLPSLKMLHLTDIGMSDQALNNLLSGCPCLEKLHILYCHGLQNPQVLSLSLKTMEYIENYRGSARMIKVEARNLHSFVYEGSDCMRKAKCDINLFGCLAIRNLSFSEANLTGQWLEDLIPQLSLLESLNFDCCYGVKHIKIRNQRLKELDFDCRVNQLDLLEVTIDTPNLVSFTYSGYVMLKVSINAPNLSNADISICGQLEKKAYNREWYTSLIKFLLELNGAKNVSIFCGYEKAIIVPNELREIFPSPLSGVKNLKVKTASPLFRKVMFKKSLLWISPSKETLTLID